MLYLTDDSDLKMLNLTDAQVSQLSGKGIDSIGDLLSLRVSEWEKFCTKGLYRKLKQKLNNLHWDGQGVYLEEDKLIRIPLDQDKTIFIMAKEDGTIAPFRDNTPITILKDTLNIWVMRALSYRKIDTIGKLISTPKDLLTHMPVCGRTSIEQLLMTVDILKRSVTEEAREMAERCGQEQSVIQAISDKMDMNGSELRRIVLLACMQDSDKPVLERIPAMECMQQQLNEWFLSGLDKYNGQAPVQWIRKQMPAMITDDMFSQYLAQLESEGKIRMEEGIIKRCLPSVVDFVASLQDGTARKMMLDRLHGMTLAEVGSKCGVSRERARQIWQKNIDRAPLLDEDKYRYIWENYEFESPGDFKKAFSESDATVNYLDARYKMHRNEEVKDIAEILSDEQVPEEVREKAKTAVYKDYLTIGAVHVRKNRVHLLRYVIRQCCQEQTPFGELVNRYQSFLSRWGLEQNPDLMLKNENGPRTRIANYDYVLWNRNKTLRYYDMNGRDFDELLETLHSGNLCDIDFSALKLFRDYPELMKTYDIRDEYELHNLLKKLWGKYRLNEGLDSHHKVTFTRMPTIVVGMPDRDRQVMQILMNKGTVPVEELCQAYEEEYGVRSGTEAANYLGSFYKYFHNGIYSVEWVRMNPQVQEKLKQILNNDFYLFSESRNIFKTSFPGENMESLNSHTLKEIGFMVYTNYVVRNTYASASQYFQHILTETDIVDFRDKKDRYLYLPTFYQVLTDLKQAGEIVESEPWLFVRRDYMERHGIGEKQIEDFTERIISRIPEGTFFTMESLQEDGVWSPHEDKRMGSWFASSLLTLDDAHFSYIRLASTRLMYRGNKQIYMVDFYRWLAREKNITNMKALESVITGYYRLSFNKDNAKELIRNDPDLNTLYFMRKD